MLLETLSEIPLIRSVFILSANLQSLHYSVLKSLNAWEFMRHVLTDRMLRLPPNYDVKTYITACMSKYSNDYAT